MIVASRDLYQPPLALWAVAWRLAVSVLLVAIVYLIISRAMGGEPLLQVLSETAAGSLVLVVLAAFGLLLGLPLYLVYRRLNLRAAWLFALGAALVAAAVYAWPDAIPRNSSFAFYADGQDVFVAGERTAFGWERFRQDLLLNAVLGGCSGLVFWVLLRWRRAARD